MKYEKINERYVISIEPGEQIVQQLTDFAKKESISNASFLGIGATDNAELAHFSVPKQEYSSKIFEGAFEIAQLSGNIFLLEGEPLVHAHMTIGDKNFATFSGHLVDARISAACEIVLTVLNSKISKKHSEKIGLKLLHLNTV